MNTSQRRRLAGTLKNTAYGSHIRRRITSADGPLTRGNSDAAGARRPPASDKSPMSMNGLLRCQAKLTQPKAGVAACLAMIPSAYNGTSCPATAASNGGSSERSSEGLDSRWALPGAGSFNRPTVREVVSNRTEQKNFKKYSEGRSISGYSNMLPTKTGAALVFYL